MVRPVSSEDGYVTFRGVSVAVAVSNYRRRVCSTARSMRARGAYVRARVVVRYSGMLRRCFQRTLWTVDQSSGYTYWTPDSGHLSLSSPLPAPLPTALRRPSGGVGEKDEAEEEQRDDGEGRIEPSGNTCRCLRPELSPALSRYITWIYYIRARLTRARSSASIRFIARIYTQCIHGGINKAPYRVNYDRAACPAGPMRSQGCLRAIMKWPRGAARARAPHSRAFSCTEASSTYVGGFIGQGLARAIAS